MFMFTQSPRGSRISIPKTIEGMSGSKVPSMIFRDWCECSAIAIQNACTIQNGIWQHREDRYKEIMSQYSREDRQKFSEMFAELVELFDEDPSDYLGKFYMESNASNKHTGQFFTPFNLSLLTAELSYKGMDQTICEPASGSGGMIIAYACVAKERGENYQKHMKVVTQDLDWLAVHMTYIQLSLMGIDAVVYQGDTLAEPVVKDPMRTFRTPKHMGVLL